MSERVSTKLVRRRAERGSNMAQEILLLRCVEAEARAYVRGDVPTVNALENALAELGALDEDTEHDDSDDGVRRRWRDPLGRLYHEYDRDEDRVDLREPDGHRIVDGIDRLVAGGWRSEDGS